MLGREHALSGLAAGLAVAGLGLHLHTGPLLALAAGTGAFATVPDMDTLHSCAARSLGFLSEAFALLIEKLSGGHRHATHSLLGVAVFTLDAQIACYYRHDPGGRIGLGLVLAIALAAGLSALHVHRNLADLLALPAAAAIAVTGWNLELVPLACGLGCLTHITGDMLTTEGCPLAWPVTLKHYRLLPGPLDFTTGTWRETWVVFPSLLGAIGLLGYLAVTTH